MNKVKKVTKRKIKSFVINIKDILKSQLNWELYSASAFIYGGKVNLSVSYKGQGINEIIYNEKYAKIIDLTDYIKNTWDYNTKDAVDAIYSDINNMIEEYENETIPEVEFFDSLSISEKIEYGKLLEKAYEIEVGNLKN